jgi:CRP-like cAMP-binding protein
MRLLRPSKRHAPTPAEIEEHVTALSAVGILAGAPAELLRGLAAATERLKVAAGTDVVREGRVPTHFYVVASGLLEVFSTGEGEHEMRKVASLQEGDHFGEIGLLEGMPATATVRAETDTVLYRVGAAQFLEAVSASPALASVLLDRVAGGLAKTHPSYAPARTSRPSHDVEVLLRDLAQVGDVVGPALRPPGEAALLKTVTATAMNLFDAAACSVALLLADGSIEFKAASGEGASEILGRIVPRGAGIAGAAIASRATLVIDDVERDERFAGAFAHTTGYRPRKIVARALEGSTGTVGVIEVLDGGAFDDDRARALSLLDLFGSLAATAIENGRAFSGFGRLLLAAAGAATAGTPLGQALENAAATVVPHPGAERLSALAHRVMQLDEQQRSRAIDAFNTLLDDAGPRGS